MVRRLSLLLISCFSIMVVILVILIIILAFTGVFNAEIIEPTRVTIPLGTIEGYYRTAQNGRKFLAFEGIPYAKPPVGIYRFREPQPLKPWTGIWIANETVHCLQYKFLSEIADKVEGQEDCLYLNVYAPENVQNLPLLDVIVHIHGGAFMFGSGNSWGPEILMENDIIYINLNYRLGPLGFLSTEDDIVPGNNGLKDQSMALRWIKKYIRYFGGNSESVTITGLSAGSASVTYHYLSPLSYGLFNRGIALSGANLNPWAQAEAVFEKTKKLASSVGCYHESKLTMINCLRHRPAHHIVRNVKLFQPFLENPFSPFGPVVERHNENSFLSKLPFELLDRGEFQDLPLIMSVVEAEGLYPGAEFLRDSSYLPYINEHWDELAPFILDFNYTIPVNDHVRIARKIKEYYLGDKLISIETFKDLMKMMSDRLFISTIETTARLFAKGMASPVYFEYFTYRANFSNSERFSNGNRGNYGVCHGDNLFYIFDHDVEIPQADEYIRMKNISMNLWLNFAKNGVPIIPNVEYKPISSEDDLINYLHVESPYKLSMKKIRTLSNIDFWDSLPFKENLNLMS